MVKAHTLQKSDKSNNRRFDFEVLTTVAMKNSVFWNIMSCSSGKETADSEDHAASVLRVKSKPSKKPADWITCRKTEVIQVHTVFFHMSRCSSNLVSIESPACPMHTWLDSHGYCIFLVYSIPGCPWPTKENYRFFFSMRPTDLRAEQLKFDPTYGMKTA